MAKLGSITVNEIEIVEVDASPITSGVDANDGSFAILTDGSAMFLKTAGGPTAWQAINKAFVGLGNADNTSDVNKPVSTAQQTALNLKANLAGGNALTGNQSVTSGFLGIGKIPSQALDIEGSNVTVAVRATSPSGVGFIDLKNDAGQYLNVGTYGTTASSTLFDNTSSAKTFMFGSAGPMVIGNFSSQPLIFGTAALGRLKIEATGEINTINNDIINALTGLVTSNTVIAATDSVRTAIGKSQGQINVKANSTITISAGTGLTGGGDLTANRTISMPAVGIPAIYGSATQVPVLTTDTQGRVSSVTSTTITGVPAANITNTPAGNIAATNVQAAIDELDSEKANLVGGNAFTGNQSVTSGSVALGTVTQQASSILTLQSTTQGVLLPRMTTTQRLAIASPVIGLLVFDTNLGTLCEYSGTAWKFEYRLITTAIQTSLLATYADITEFTTLPLDVGLYVIELKGIMQSTATGTGVGLRLNQLTSVISTIVLNWEISQAGNGTSKDFGYVQAALAADITSASVLTANSNFPVFGNGVFRVTTTGTVAIQIRSETAATGVSIRPDSTLLIKKIG